MFSCEKKNPVRKWSAVCMNSHVQKATFARKGATQISDSIAMLSDICPSSSMKDQSMKCSLFWQNNKNTFHQMQQFYLAMHSNSALSDSDILTTCRNCTMVVVLREMKVRLFKYKTVQYKKAKTVQVCAVLN